MKTLIELKPRDIVFYVTKEAKIASQEIISIHKTKIETTNGLFSFSEEDHTRFSFPISSSSYFINETIFFIDRNKAIKQAIKIQKKIIKESYSKILEANVHHSNMYEKLVSLTNELNEKN